MDRIARRNILNNVMLTVTGICTVLTVSTLFLILGYLVVNGWRALDWNFFTKLPLASGESGGGMANAIVGSGLLILIAAAIGIPVGFLGGVYLAEFGHNTIPMLIRYTADLLNGVPSIVIGIFAWTVIVVPMHHFSAWAGGFALSLMMIPIGLRATEQFLRSVPNSLREGSLALGASKTRTIISVIVPAAKQDLSIWNQFVPVSEGIDARADHECINLRVAIEAQIAIGAGEISGDANPFSQIVIERGVPSVQIEMVEVRHVRAGIGTVILKTAKDFCPGRVFRQELKR